MIYLDDSIMQKGFTATAGSAILENFTAPFDATVAVRLKEKTERIKLAEFGLADPGDLPGTPLLCNDVLGHIRCRAAEQELCYIRPTYGTVSRFGLIPAACSMDQIGIVCKNPAEGFSLLQTISGHDEKDGAMFPQKHYSYAKAEKEPVLADRSLELPFSGVYRQVLEILAYAEICNNISRYDGIKFGYRAENCKNPDELYTKTRTEALGPEAKFAATAGCLILSQDYYSAYYEKAMKIRRLIKESLRFDTFDVIEVAAGNPVAVLAGLPSLTFRRNTETVQLVANVKKENLLLAAWRNLS